jgi:hypothetical protein
MPDFEPTLPIDRDEARIIRASLLKTCPEKATGTKAEQLEWYKTQALMQRIENVFDGRKHRAPKTTAGQDVLEGLG